MKLISNLEELKVGDFISSSGRGLRRDKIIYEIVVINNKVIQIETRKKKKYVFGENGDGKYFDDYTNDESDIIFKKVKKIKKKKLKHKLVTYCDWIIFKLNEKEKQEIIKMGILENLNEKN